MKHFWTLPALLRVVLASRHVFSVHDDVLAFPQYAVAFTDDYVSDAQARSRMDSNKDLGVALDTDRDTALQNQQPSHSSLAFPERFEYELMTAADSQRYLCRIPLVDPLSGDDANDTLTRADEEKELARANDRGWELLQGMQGNCIYYWSGWWSYRYCYGQGVKQFHQLPPTAGMPSYPPVEDPGVVGFVLGKVEEAADGKGESGLQRGAAGEEEGQGPALGKLETRGENRYLVQRLGGGTMCDLTGKERRVEVQYHCNAATSDRISLIKEVATCAYLLVIQTPRLCNDVAFLPPQKDSPNTIACSPILAEEDIPEYEAALAAAGPSDMAQQIPNPFEQQEQPTKPIVVGGIVLGAHKWIAPGKVVEKSAIVGGGKETYVETVADSLGKVLTGEQLKKMGLGDAKNVERLKKELEKIAGGKEWKLEVFDTPRGREYRGVIGEDGEEGDGEEGGGGGGGGADTAGSGDAADAAKDGEEGSEETYKQRDEL